MKIVYDGICFAAPVAMALFKKLQEASKIIVADVKTDHPMTREEMEER